MTPCTGSKEAMTKAGARLGKNVSIIGDVHYSSEPYLIKIGDNTTISFECAFITHNTIIGAGSLVCSNIPSGVVAAGNPCKVICTLDEYRKKHKDDFLYMVSLPPDKKRAYLMKHFKING